MAGEIDGGQPEIRGEERDGDMQSERGSTKSDTAHRSGVVPSDAARDGENAEIIPGIKVCWRGKKQRGVVGLEGI